MVGLAAATAMLLGYLWAIRAEGLDARSVCVAVALIAVATFAGGRLHFVLANWARLQDQTESAFRFSSGALHAPGAIVGAALAVLVVLPLLSLPIGRFVDGVAPAVGIGIALARFGCFLHGCCYGHLCSLPWGVTLPPDSYVFARQLDANLLPPHATRSLPVHPLPLYFAAVGIGATVFLLRLRRRKRYHGQLGLWLLALFSVSSAILEPFRADDPGRVYLGPLPQLLWVTLGMAIVSVAALGVAEYRHRVGDTLRGTD